MLHSTISPRLFRALDIVDEDAEPVVAVSQHHGLEYRENPGAASVFGPSGTADTKLDPSRDCRRARCTHPQRACMLSPETFTIVILASQAIPHMTALAAGSEAASKLAQSTSYHNQCTLIREGPECPRRFVPVTSPKNASHFHLKRAFCAMPRYSCSCKWMPASTDLPTFCGGYSGPGEAMYVARFHHSNDILPGYISGVPHTARSSYGGQQRESTDYEVLVESYPDEFAWIPAASGSVPDGAVRGGVTASGEILYISRVHNHGYFILGKVHPSHRCCYYPFAGKELKANNYEVLVCSLIMHHDHENTSNVSSEGVTDSVLDEHDYYYDSDDY